MIALKRFALAAFIGASALAGSLAAAHAADTMVITTKDGDIEIALRPDLAPNHVKQIEALAKKGFYDGVVFHRVIDGFMAQTGDPTGTGMGGSDLPDLKAEFSKETFDRGTIGMARSSDPNSANSQFFIMLANGDFLDGQYTIVGEVIEGMDVVDKIKKGEPVRDPDKITTLRVAADL